jgi:predicted small lipoprotein YifL
MKPLSWLMVILLLLSLAGCGSGNSPTEVPPNQINADSPAYEKLAVIESGSPNPSPDLIANFRTVMGSLAIKCWKDDPGRLADFVVKSQSILKESGKTLGLLEIARNVDKSIPEGTQVAQCSDTFALFVSMVK